VAGKQRKEQDLALDPEGAARHQAAAIPAGYVRVDEDDTDGKSRSIVREDLKDQYASLKSPRAK
jgi:hypothetical protein